MEPCAWFRQLFQVRELHLDGWNGIDNIRPPSPPVRLSGSRGESLQQQGVVFPLGGCFFLSSILFS